MAKKMLKFGNVSAADIQLRLIASNGEEYGANPIHLHSQVVKKSKFLESMISERWSSDDRPLKTEVLTTVTGFENYVKCFGVMNSYAIGGRVCFSSVEECLAILQVAAHLLVNDCINDSMKYLAAVRWTLDEESEIRAVLSSLQLQTLPDLTARLDKLGCNKYLEMLEESTKEMVSIILERKCSWEQRETICEYLKGKCDRNSSPEIADACKRVFYEEFTANIEFIKSSFTVSRMESKHARVCSALRIEFDRARKWSALRWLVEMFEKWDTSLYETVLKTYFKDVLELAGSIASKATVQQKQDALKIILGFLKAIGNAKVITTRAFRLSLLQTWLPPVVDMIDESSVLKDSIEADLIKVFETVPVSDQKSIYKVWTEAYRNKKMDYSKMFNWWFEKLEEGYSKSKVEE